MKIITHSPQETIEAAKKLGSLLKAGDMIAYKGGLGAGKTTFTRGIAIGMGFDMYRIDSEDDLESTGFYDYPFEENVAAVEWSENIAEFLPKDTIYVTIDSLGENDREITIEDGGRFAAAWD